MSRRTQAIFTGGIAALATVFGALQSGVLPFSPQKGMDVTLRWHAADRQLRVERDGGNMNCVIRLRPSRIAAIPKARTTTNHPLDVSRCESAPDWLCISEPTTAAERPVKLLWPGGESIVVTPIDGPVVDWRVDQEHGPSDSSEKQRQRRIWLVFVTIPSVLIATLAAVVAVVDKEEPPKPPPLSAARVIEMMVPTIEGASLAETEAMQRHIRRFLLVGKKAALAAVRDSADRRLALQGLRMFRATLDQMIKELDQQRTSLG